ncbi:MAG TPA: hypothetical protein DF712_13375 [Balneola sp.]|mgnify:FL=1|nr:hypothetical protein [Balneola sp.]|tara:strand:- start:879 stop:1760 length:882 start_codon:yes stop_codon:yes gene_type:complete
MSKITDLLKEVGKDVLTEESLETIETVFNEAVEKKATERAELATEAALQVQDDEHSKKLEELLEAIDKDHAKKLEKVVEAVDTDRTRKLKNVIRKYQTAIAEEASGLKETMVESVSDYLDSYITDTLPTETIEEATKNRRAFDVLSEIRKMLSVDMVLANESIREAVKDGKATIEESKKSLAEMTEYNSDLKIQLEGAQKELFLEKKLAGFDEKKAKFVRKTFADKELAFIEENFDYTVTMFDKKTEEALQVLKEEATKECKAQEAEVVVEESSSTPKSATELYAAELAAMRL